MTVLDNDKIKKIHCLGIGGIGVSGVAELLLQRGYQVSGTDMAQNANVQRLQQLGVLVFSEHKAENIADADAVVYSSAIQKDNPEYLAAVKRELPLLRRGEMLAELMAEKRGIAIAGTHGKTTTTSLMAHTFLTANIDASYVIGGVINDQASPVHMGTSPYMVAEADESDVSFLFLQPHIAVITNIDSDHLGAYDGNFNLLKKAFLDFLAKIPRTGLAVVCIDDPVLKTLVTQIHCRVVTYGNDASADYSLHDFHQHEMVGEFQVQMKRKQQSHLVRLQLLGLHNALNALAVIAVADEVGIAPSEWQKAFSSFPGVGRRFAAHGVIQAQGGTALLFDDYGHHPRELRATISAARSAWPNRRLVWVFQPHRFSRTQELMQQFAEVLAETNLCVLMEIYSAGELAIDGVDAQALQRQVQAAGGQQVEFAADLQALLGLLRQHLKDGDIVVMQGAGNIGLMAEQVAKQLSPMFLRDVSDPQMVE